MAAEESPAWPEGMGMRKPKGRGWVLVAVLAGLVLVPGALAHGNVLAVDSQHTADGTVQVEGVYTLTPSWVVVHADDGGAPGAVLGATAVGSETYHTDVGVRLNRSTWESWEGARTVHVLMHNDDGDGEFHPGSDPIIGGSDDPVGGTITLERADRAAVVAAQHFETPTVTGNATVRRVVLPTEGRLVLHESSVAGQVVATRSLAAGTHTDLSLALDEEFYRYQGSTFTLVAVLYRGGEGEPIDESTRITAGERPVATTLQLEPENTTTPPTPTPEPTPTETPTTERTDGSTPTTTAEDGDDKTGDAGHDHEDGHDQETDEATPTATAGNNDGQEGDGDHDHEDGHDHESTGASPAEGGGGGFGLLVAVVALVGAGLVAVRHRG